MVVHISHPALRRLQQEEDHHRFEASLSYIKSSGPHPITSKTVSKKKRTKIWGYTSGQRPWLNPQYHKKEKKKRERKSPLPYEISDLVQPCCPQPVGKAVARKNSYQPWPPSLCFCQLKKSPNKRSQKPMLTLVCLKLTLIWLSSVAGAV